MESDKVKNIEIPNTSKFRSLGRMAFVALIGAFALHLGWWQLVETYVPQDERSKHFEFLGKLNSALLGEKKKTEETSKPLGKPQI